jgi:hypothetical protein
VELIDDPVHTISLASKQVVVPVPTFQVQAKKIKNEIVNVNEFVCVLTIAGDQTIRRPIMDYHMVMKSKSRGATVTVFGRQASSYQLARACVYGKKERN